MASKNALGKGLDALLGDTGKDLASVGLKQPASDKGIMSHLPIEQIEVNPFQPRTHFDQEKLDELAASISQFGIIQPLTVRKVAMNRYQLISGERRFRASQLLGLQEVPVFLRVANDSSMLEMALVENIQRDDLDAIDVAISYQRLINECDLTQEKLGDRVGKKRSTITNYLRLLKLPAQIQKAIKDKVITMGHARSIIGLEDEQQQLQLFKEIIKNAMSVRATEQATRKVNRAKKSSSPKELPIEWEHVRDNVQEQLGARVKLSMGNTGKGSISIAFKDDADLKRLLSILDLWP